MGNDFGCQCIAVAWVASSVCTSFTRFVKIVSDFRRSYSYHSVWFPSIACSYWKVTSTGKWYISYVHTGQIPSRIGKIQTGNIRESFSSNVGIRGFGSFSLAEGVQKKWMWSFSQFSGLSFAKKTSNSQNQQEEAPRSLYMKHLTIHKNQLCKQSILSRTCQCTDFQYLYHACPYKVTECKAGFEKSSKLHYLFFSAIWFITHWCVHWLKAFVVNMPTVNNRIHFSIRERRLSTDKACWSFQKNNKFCVSQWVLISQFCNLTRMVRYAVGINI